MRWVTRSFPGVDRTASAWLIKRFVDPEAEFTFIDWPEEELKPEYGIPFDIEGVEHGHRDGKCTFEVIVERYSIQDPYVRRMAEIVHAADIRGEEKRAPVARGIKAILDGLRFVTRSDSETLRTGMMLWEALYVHLRLEDLKKELREELESLSRTGRLRLLKMRLQENRGTLE